jgi:hypothetical protein
MLSMGELRAALERWSYRPGWKFMLYQHPFEGIWISIVAELDDADNPGHTVVNRANSAVPPMPTGAYFYEWLLWRCGRIESHEAREFARVDGVKLHDPHAPDANDP